MTMTTPTTTLTPPANATPNSPARVLFASLVGTTIEYFDFLIFGTAAVLIFPTLFFPSNDPALATLMSFAIFSLAFFGRVLGAAVFGHFGDRYGRKTTLVVALVTMGGATIAIGLLPTYASIGIAAPILLALCRFTQGVGLAGEWGGAMLLAIENAPPKKRALYSIFPQCGVAFGFMMATGVFLLLNHSFTHEELLSYAWRIPFIANVVLVGMGLYVRLKLYETPEFLQAVANEERVKVPLGHIIKNYWRMLLLGALAVSGMALQFYLMAVFALKWGISNLHYARTDLLLWQLLSMVFLISAIAIAGRAADRYGWRAVMTWGNVATVAFGLVAFNFFVADNIVSAGLFICAGFFVAGLVIGPLGLMFASSFPTALRFTGTTVSFNLASVIGAALAPAAADKLAMQYGLDAVGYYLAVFGVIACLAVQGMAKFAAKDAKPNVAEKHTRKDIHKDSALCVE